LRRILDAATAWATSASYQIRVFPNPELQPLKAPDIVYYRAGNIDLQVSVFMPGPETVVRPTVLYIHGGGWVHYTKDNMFFSLLPYLARRMDVVNVDYRPGTCSSCSGRLPLCTALVFKQAKELGFDTQPVVVAGGSAGGHLALLTGMLDKKAGFDDACAFSSGRGWSTQ
jgi:acetyl esterase/lipase